MNRTPAERFASKIVKTAGGCWLWTGKKTNGYGQLSVDGRYVYAMRWAYEQLHGPMPPGIEPDHLCRKRSCVNPAHAEPVTRRENLLRGDTVTARHAAKTACPQGHPYSLENTYAYRGQRHCRTCRRAHNKTWREAARRG